MKQKIRIECNECKNLIESVKIDKTQIKVNNEKMELQYFECPKCSKIYKVLLLDSKAKALQNEMLGYRSLYQKVNTPDSYSKYIIRKAHFESYLERLEKQIKGGCFIHEGKKIIYVPDKLEKEIRK